MALETRIYQKESNVRPGKLFKESFRDIYNSRFLARQLAERDIKAQYRQSYLGIIWAFLTPLATAAVWVFLNLSGTIKITETGIPYPVYAFTGTLLWSIITEAINSPSGSTKSARGLLSKINFPKEALIVSGIYKLLFNSSIKILLLVAFVFLFGIGFHWSLLLLPIVILGAVLFGVTIGLFLTPIGMLYNDVSKIIGMGFSFLMYITPVVYSVPEQGIMRTIMEINPFTPIILTSRDLITGASPEYLTYYLIILALTVPLFVVALLSYRISIPIIVERSA
ncbi:lipopolysaccharide transport system permease protein [Salinimicrobium catena]|uniref:Lipopolysaccharide transport system permease protein n=1 Tax=Salinimicrobium catena TaxID=390640 RepID=A0A1H5NB97_9FLAO|nr:ABC transporter permease [Salinimicrobium catena]SDL41582.1 lipopolysaccharide transport system permease protein [Salinimicrobium catena]SEE98740.1 lipopolysaccharide transport system permease protein [Salinimicrobium catena]